MPVDGGIGELTLSPQDRRFYRLVALPNAMQALLIHDPEIALAIADDAGAEKDAGAKEPAATATGASVCSQV
eukprot:SAG11_NODE_106_length_16423_cov_51.220840_12_plen_72_part_00